MPTILVVTWRDIENEEAGGEERFLYEVLDRFGSKPENEVVYLCSKGDELPRYEEKSNITFVRTGSKVGFFARAPFYVLSLVNEWKPDLVIENVTGIPFYTPLYLDLPILAIKHHIQGKVFFRELPLPIAICGWVLERSTPWTYGETPFLTVSRSSLEEMAKRGYNVAGIVRNGVKSELLEEDEPSEARSNSLVYLGRLKEYKNLDELIAVFAKAKNRMSDLTLHIAGSGDYEQELRRIIAEKGVEESVHLHGYVSERKKKELLKNSDLFVTTSRKEGWGITVIEANALGTPAVGYDVPGLQDSILDDRTGILCEGGQSDMVEAILEVMKDADYLERLSLNARDWAENFDWSESARTFQELVEERLRGVNSGGRVHQKTRPADARRT